MYIDNISPLQSASWLSANGVFAPVVKGKTPPVQATVADTTMCASKALTSKVKAPMQVHPVTTVNKSDADS